MASCTQKGTLRNRPYQVLKCSREITPFFSSVSADLVQKNTTGPKTHKQDTLLTWAARHGQAEAHTYPSLAVPLTLRKMPSTCSRRRRRPSGLLLLTASPFSLALAAVSARNGGLPAPTYSLHDAAAAGDMSAVDLLLSAGLSSNELNARRSTPLHIAALKGHREIAALLLAHGADPNAANMGGSTPLHAAVEMGQHELAELLVSSGADASSPSGLLSPESAAPRMIAATGPWGGA